MSRLLLTIAVWSLVAAAVPAAAETWDCGESVVQSGVLTINTDTSPCGGSTMASAGFIIETDLCGSQGFAEANENIVIDGIWSPGSMKKHPLGQRVTLLSLPVTRAFAQRFYIEPVDRTSGIGVMAGVTADPGRLATVTGTISLVDGEIVLADEPVPPYQPVEVTLGALGECPKPFGMSSRALELGIGLDPTGLLVKVWGKAISVPEGETYYLVSDGGVPFAVLPEGVARPDQGSDVILTGIPGVATVAGQQVRVFRVNAQ